MIEWIGIVATPPVMVAVGLAAGHGLGRFLGQPPWPIAWATGLGFAVSATAVAMGPFTGTGAAAAGIALSLTVPALCYRLGPVALLALPLLAVPAWSTRPVDPPIADPIVVLVTLDTVRADLALHEWVVPVPTPHLDALGAQGTTLTQGVSPVPLTLPAHAAIMSGLRPPDTGAVRNGHRVATEALVALQFEAAGWNTGAFVSSPVLTGETGLNAGFEHYNDAIEPPPGQLTTWGRLSERARPARRVERRGDATVRAARRWLSEVSGPTFVWVHLYDAHAPYAPPSPFDATLDPADLGEIGGPRSVAQGRAARRTVTAREHSTISTVPRDLRPALAAYAGEVAWVDHLVGRLLADLPEASVVVTADHGESLVEHDYLLNHGARLYQPSVRVPAWIRGPGVPAGERSHAPISTRWTANTLLVLAGLEASGPTLLTAPTGATAYAPGQQSRHQLGWEADMLVSIRDGAHKWIVHADDTVEHYDLAVDPGEARDLGPRLPAADHPRGQATGPYRARLEATDRAPDDALSQALELLGYVEP